MQLGRIIFLDHFLPLRLLHEPLPSNHLQPEPVDIYIVQLGSILDHDRFRQLRLLHGLLPRYHIHLERVDI